MGYDFMFLGIGAHNSYNFPLAFSDAPTSGPVSVPWSKFRERILARGARQNGGPDILWLAPETDQSICFYGDPQAISLDVHADWNHVLALYREFRQDEPNLLVFDQQRGCFHDEASFCQFMTECGHQPSA